MTSYVISTYPIFENIYKLTKTYFYLTYYYFYPLLTNLIFFLYLYLYLLLFNLKPPFNFNLYYSLT